MSVSHNAVTSHKSSQAMTLRSVPKLCAVAASKKTTTSVSSPEFLSSLSAVLGAESYVLSSREYQQG